MNKRGLFKLIIVIVVLVVAGFFWFVSQTEEIECVPASCCHSSGCVLASEAPNCSGRICTASCEPDTLDCGQARCEYVGSKCEVVFNE